MEAERRSTMSSLKGQLSNVEGSVKSMKVAVVVGSVLTVACLAAVFGVTVLANEVSKEVKTEAPDLETKVLLETLTSLETSLARTVTPKTAARQATVRTDPTTTVAFMVLTDPSTLDNCPLRLDIVLLLSESIMIVCCLLVTSVFEFVFVKVRERKLREHTKS